MNASSFAPALPRLQLYARLDALFRLFANILFAVCLLAAWGVLTLIGVIITQEQSAAFYFQNYPPEIARLILRLGFDTIYHGPWYLTNLGLILASLGVCTFRRVIPARIPRLGPIRIEFMPLHTHIAVQGSEAVVRTKLADFLTQRGWTVRNRTLDGAAWIFGDKHNWARRGVLVAHIGFVILAAGTCIYWARGFSGRTALLVGTTGSITQTGAQIRLDSFHSRIDQIPAKSGVIYQPIDYVSHVRITPRNGVPRDEVIRVNHPADIDGTLLYQSTYGVGMHFSLYRNGRKLTQDVPQTASFEGDTFAIPGTRRSIRYRKFVGTIDAAGLPSADPRPNRPGALIEILENDELIGDGLLPLNRPADIAPGIRIVPDGIRYYSGFDYRFDPGIPVVAVGAFVMLAGFCICLYLAPARLHAVITGADNSWKISLAATTVKGHEVFEEQFNSLTAALAAEQTKQ